MPAVAAAWNPSLILATAVWNVALVALLIVERAVGFSRASLEIDRFPPDQICVGVENTSTLVVKSFARFPLHVRLIDGWPAEFTQAPEEHRFSVPSFKSVTLATKVVPGGRGEFTLGPIHARVRSPLGLVDRKVTFGEPRKVRVYPNLKELRRYDLLARRGLLQHQGFRSVRRVGEGMEFERMREYTSGDEFRLIDWKATAKRRKPITRVHETERGQMVLVALDAGRLMAAASGGLTKLDYAINASLMLGYVALRRGDRVGLTVFSSEVESFALPRAGRAALARLMEALVPLQPRLTFSNYRAAVEAIARKMRRRALVVMFTDLADPEAAKEIVATIPRLRRNHLPMCVSFRDPELARLATDPPPPDEHYAHVAAMELEAERRHALMQLRMGGVSIVDVPPDQVAVEAVNRYLQLKHRQAI